MAAAQGKKALGYSRELWILPFDHRGSFQSKMFGIKGTPTPEETREIASFKTVVYEGFEKAVRNEGLPKEKMGVLVDEQFGTEVLTRARHSGVLTCVPAEKSGQDEFDFEYGDHWQEHITKVNPNFVKVLVRYNPEGEKELNHRQAVRLAALSDFLHKAHRYYMFELLVPATPEQLAKCGGDTKTYDREIRPALMVRSIQELQAAGVEPDVWKLEGLEREADFERVCTAARAGGRESVGCILLGRGESDEKVREWLSVGARVPGVIGFAVGRTIFWEPLKALREKKISRDEASTQIANKYASFCKLWMAERGA